MAMERRDFDREFREGAVRIVRETGKPIAQVARELGVRSGTLGRWVNLDRRAREGDSPLSESERDELNRLRKENAELAMERDVLKRSAALWVKEAMRRSAWPYLSLPRGQSTVSRMWCRAGRWGVAGVVLQVALRGWLTTSASAKNSGGHHRLSIPQTQTDLWFAADHRRSAAMGWQVSKNIVAALMREQGLVARRTRRRRGTT
jgi:transposase